MKVTKFLFLFFVPKSHSFFVICKRKTQKTPHLNKSLGIMSQMKKKGDSMITSGNNHQNVFLFSNGELGD